MYIDFLKLPELPVSFPHFLIDYCQERNQLAFAYDNPNKIQEAEDKLLACKQSTDALYIYPDANKIIAFRNSLNSTIRTRLNGQLTLSTTYTEYVHVTQQLRRSSGSSGLSGSSYGFLRPSAPLFQNRLPKPLTKKRVL
ncbi:hypothetical protein MBM_04496 [Drepanopeziza brunnea f. sp. 'multigermtubi' MB_m1]|uniref:Uncharacterized protein n=1 Tax=Marssonina brunnea f. sp. multigermtubi (strain MB_m1) TaxID=1072389 RepID=K1XW01_MARBU|nr:uncharacterized protein MBM_04496 [Drepanopeziza brunnea f. sp. 'multigermtubi' MB_m1]EKD16919.1 hypothetical protein MBM_04496 [Drepanopeziza brunnea f. sp. 'multigermtubi' MB_m1]